MEETKLLKKLESIQLKKQVEVLSTFLPDQILKFSENDDKMEKFFGALVLIEVSGFTSLCEKYNKLANGGNYRLTATINAFVGAITEIVHFYGGDLLKFTGDEYLVCWKVGEESEVGKTILDVLVCSFFIHDNFGWYETEVNITLKAKFSVSYGDVKLFIIDGVAKDYMVLGSAIEDIKTAKCICFSGDIVLSPTAWNYLATQNFDYSSTANGFVKVWNCSFHPDDKYTQNDYEEKQVIVEKLCLKHLEHRNLLHKQKRFGDTITDGELTDHFVRTLPQRSATKIAAKYWQLYDIKPFVTKMVQNQLDEGQPVENLTEMREVSIQYINIVCDRSDEAKFIEMLKQVYRIIEDTVNRVLGVIADVSLLEKDVMVLVIFGLRGYKYEIESKNALTSGFKLQQFVSEVAKVNYSSVGVTNGFIYTGVVGHPFRRTFIVSGKAINRAGKLMLAFPNKVTCDHKSYRNSKLSSYYFRLQSSLNLKGIEENIFEYNEDFVAPVTPDTIKLIGREKETDLIYTIINHPDKVNYLGICFHGEEKLGKSKLMESSIKAYESSGYSIASIELCRNSQRPYFCVSQLYKQLYNLKSRLNSEEFVFVKNLPSDLWDFTEILQGQTEIKSLVGVQRKFKILNLFREITASCPLGFAVLFIDSIQYIDAHSFDILEIIIKEKHIRLICTGQFEEDFWDIRWKISLNNEIKLLDLQPLNNNYLPSFITNFLHVDAVAIKLLDIVRNVCGGIPGLIERFILNAINTGNVQLGYVTEEICQEDYVLVHDYYDHQTNKVLVCKVGDEFSCHEKASLSSMSLHTLDNFVPFQLSLIKACSALGEIFNRSLLTLICKYPSEYIFANTIKIFFNKEIFECGSKFLISDGSIGQNLFCGCIVDEDELKQNKSVSKFPKYAFCQVIHFKNQYIRQLAYNMLDCNQKRELHLKVTDILENQRHSCGNCLKNNFAPIIVIPKYRDVVYMCSEAKVLNDNDDFRGYMSNESSNIEYVLTKNMQTSGKFKIAETDESSTLRRKIWDPSICSCLEIVIKIYEDLVYHSKEAGHPTKLIHFLMQYGFIMMLMNEFEDAIPPLQEALDVCNTGPKGSKYELPDTFRGVHIGKINLLLGQAYLNLGDTIMVRKYLLESLKQYELSLMPVNGCTKFFGRQFLAKLNYGESKIYSKNAMFKSDFGACLNLVSNLFTLEGDWRMAKIASTQCVQFLNEQSVNLNILCDIYSNAISIYNYFGDKNACDKLEKCVSQYILKKFNSNVTFDLFSISKLIYTIFQMRYLNAELEMAIRLGYRAIEFNNNIQAHYIQIDLIITLASALLLVKRIEDSVEVAKILYSIGKAKDELGLLAYYTYSFELILETSFILEPFENILEFSENYFTIANKTEFSTIEKTLLLYVYDYYLRNSRWGDVHRWKKRITFNEFDCRTVQSTKNLFKYTETLLISFVRSGVVKKYNLDSELVLVKSYMKQCKAVAKKWQVFKPRYLHFQAYYNKIRNRKGQTKKYIKQAEKVARLQGNLLERCWLVQSQNSWDGGFNFEGNRKNIDWKLAKTYSNIHWSQILYGLPWHA